jgi:NAD(P) transhydrogenase subunit alpha
LTEDGSGAGGYAKEMSKEIIAAEKALFALQSREVYNIITTALIPGKPAPVLITEDMVRSMRQGSVIVDMAAESGGNCSLTQPGQVIEWHGVTIIGYVDLPSRLAPTASQLYGSNLTHLLADMGGAKSFHIDLEDEVVRGAIVLREGELLWPPPRKEAPKPAERQRAPSIPPPPPKKAEESAGASLAAIAITLGLLLLAGAFAPPAFVGHLTVFVLSCFIGWQVVWNVTPALHTPLMSVTNAVSDIILVGGMLQISGPVESPVTILSAVAVLIATINVAGGFLVTQRMLKMFQR